MNQYWGRRPDSICWLLHITAVRLRHGIVKIFYFRFLFDI